MCYVTFLYLSRSTCGFLIPQVNQLYLSSISRRMLKSFNWLFQSLHVLQTTQWRSNRWLSSRYRVTWDIINRAAWKELPVGMAQDFNRLFITMVEEVSLKVNLLPEGAIRYYNSATRDGMCSFNSKPKCGVEHEAVSITLYFKTCLLP